MDERWWVNEHITIIYNHVTKESYQLCLSGINSSEKHKENQVTKYFLLTQNYKERYELNWYHSAGQQLAKSIHP